MWASPLFRSFGTKVIATATVKNVKGKRLIPTRAALTLTPAAVVSKEYADQLNCNFYLHFVYSKQIGLRIGVRQRGCNGLSYTLEYATKKTPMDEEVLQDGIRVLIDQKAQLTLLGTEMDYQESKLASEFVFNNPNIKGTCGCGESFSI
ncbi:Iron-sulfur cluster assembly 1, mitochondrial [Orchesella cincta]|uniref:Iron-sulfur cluster assembly 1 homolog, mitochondrial n=1 Tax=Orchesella cincta TaxID=48709 RepID=A0A1D2MY28_ORCCI|nr:Iron-sulfur cluster assembly 1, mitochondrial [Orchesella cincta]